jgi:hypothetical protein
MSVVDVQSKSSMNFALHVCPLL